jgi:hypothetical protein
MAATTPEKPNFTGGFDEGVISIADIGCRAVGLGRAVRLKGALITDP